MKQAVQATAPFVSVTSFLLSPLTVQNIYKYIYILISNGGCCTVLSLWCGVNYSCHLSWDGTGRYGGAWLRSAPFVNSHRPPRTTLCAWEPRSLGHDRGLSQFVPCLGLYMLPNSFRCPGAALSCPEQTRTPSSTETVLFAVPGSSGERPRPTFHVLHSQTPTFQGNA